MLVCPSCDRHVLADDRACPFCGNALATVRATVTMTSLVLGLALVGCAGKDSDDGVAENSMSSTSVDSMTSTSLGPDTPTGSSTTHDDWNDDASAYAGASDDWWPEETDEGTTGETETDGTDTGGTGTGTDTDSDGSGSDTEADSDTDSDTGNDAGESR